MSLIPLSTAHLVGKWSAIYIVEKINAFAQSADRPFVLDLPTGGTPLPTYKALIQLHRAGKESLQHV
ncbi:glucosamine-6-phosphate deaminase, partial [Proteus mirabilis]|nr:glucosamine-6-phosphate deaminase [Proteus mirabilis]